MEKKKLMTYALIAYLGLNTSLTQTMPVQAKGIVDEAKNQWELTLDAIEYFKLVHDYGISDEPITVIRNLEVDQSLDANEAALEYFTEQDEIQRDYASRETKSKVNYSAIAKAKTITTEGIDFIFYDAELKVYGKDYDGIYYSDLDDEVKEEIYKIVERNREELAKMDNVGYRKLSDHYSAACEDMEQAKDYKNITKTETKNQIKKEQEKEAAKEERKNKAGDFIEDQKNEFKGALDYFKDLYKNGSKKR